MNKKIIIGIVIGFFSCLQTLFAQNIEGRKGIKKGERIIHKLIRKKKVPGIAITVIKNDEVFWQKGYGYADIKEKKTVDPKNTLFRIASVSKPISATGLAKLVEEKKIDLDASLYDYVPFFPKKKYDFTIRQLGGHLAGIRTYKGREFFNKKNLSIREGVALFENDSLLFEPGTAYAYNSYDWVLISLAIQEVLKTSYEAVIKEKVIDPLKLTHTFPDKNDDTIANKAVFYSKRGKRRFRLAAEVDNYFKLAGGGYLSTSDDVAKFGNAYLKGDFIPKEIASQFVESQKINKNLTYYGLGWESSFDTGNRPYFGHTGNGIGGYAVFRVYPEQNMVFSILTNVTNPGIEDELNQLIETVLSEVEKSTKTSVP
ncbi:serine hydrolase [Flavobacteriaceae bacterium R38]|nr:serine hydrolase [Flavobacteriaceae bacterium R38]